MYNSQDIVTRIKKLLAEKNLTVREMLNSCELNINTLSKMSNGSDILTKSIVKIADYLDCSVDYLVGREASNKLFDAYMNSPDSIKDAVNKLLDL